MIFTTDDNEQLQLFLSSLRPNHIISLSGTRNVNEIPSDN